MSIVRENLLTRLHYTPYCGDEREPPVGKCPWCGETGVGFDEADRPSDYCGHDPALIRPRAASGVPVPDDKTKC